jgi:S-DNA-T family DNA segregation ATPase FtsK/SpoIIIE
LGVLNMLERRELGDIRTAIGLGLLFLIVIIVFQLQVPPDQFFAVEHVRAGGGFVGAAAAWVLLKIVGVVGSYIIMVALLVIAAILITRFSIKDLAKSTASVVSDGGAYARQTVRDKQARRDRGLRARAEKTIRRRRPRGGTSAGGQIDLDDEDDSDPPANPEPVLPSKAKPQQGAAPASPRDNPAPTVAQREPQLKLVSSPGSFVPPPVTLLRKAGMDEQTSEMQAETAERIIKLEDTLDSFGINAKVTHYERGPVLTRYEVEPERGIRVNQITRLADDLAMSLAAVDVRVEAPIPGKSAIGIEVPNEHRSLVSLRGTMESDAFTNHRGELPIALGRDIAGQPVVVDLVPMPHLLIAGATGSGKSVCLHSVILSLVMKHAPEKLRVIVIDPKRVELAVYDGIPHLMAPVV